MDTLVLKDIYCMQKCKPSSRVTSFRSFFFRTFICLSYNIVVVRGGTKKWLETDYSEFTTVLGNDCRREIRKVKLNRGLKNEFAIIYGVPLCGCSRNP